MQPIGKALERVPSHLHIVPKPQLEQDTAPIRTCPTCKFELRKESDHGWLRTGFDEVEHRTIVKPCPTCSTSAKTRLQSSAQADLTTRLFGGAHLPHKMRSYTFETYPATGDQQALEKVRQFVEQGLAGNEEMDRGLYLVGQMGRGKTGLAVCALKAVMEAGQLGLFVLVLELMHRIKATFNPNSGVASDELLEVVTTIPWLVLDDLAVERPTEFVIEQLYYIIEQRRMRGLYTILTSNLSTKELEKYWRPKGFDGGTFYPGARVVERLRDYCIGVALQCENLREEW